MEVAMNALALFSASFSIPLYATFIKSDAKRANNDLMVVAFLAAVGMLISVMALVDDQMGLTAWFGLAVAPVELV
jgi:hypothetical protein